jgi:hypothetical protein
LRSVSVSVSVLVLAVGVGGLRFYQVHSAEHAVGTLDAEMASLNAEKPAFSTALSVADTMRTAEAKVSSLTVDAPDWYAVVANLANQNPDQLAVTGFTGTATAPVTTRKGSASHTATATATTTGSTTPTFPGQIGTVSATVSGTYAGNVNCNPYAAFIGDIGAPMFGTPQSTGPTCPTTNGTTVVTFQTTIPVLSLSSLAKQGCYDVLHPAPACPAATKGSR